MESPFSAAASSPMPQSLWAATTHRASDYPTLEGETSADVCIVGGGILGLSTALALAQRNVSIVVLEAAQIGWGASGRNNGLVAPGLKRDPWDVSRKLSSEAFERLLRFSVEAPENVFRLVREHGIECDANPGGWIQASHSKSAVKVIERRVESWQALGADVEMIPSAAVADETGTAFYTGACRYAAGGSINPLAYTLGLADAAVRAGATLHEQTPALAIEGSPGQWRVRTRTGQVRAGQVLLCVNAYNDNLPQLRGSVIPVRTAQVASKPLTSDAASNILPGAAAASDTQRLLTSFRLTADNRLIMGGASATGGDEHSGLMRHLHRAASLRFPELQVQWEYGWSGYLALTPTHLPRITRIDDSLTAAVGCNGRGVALSTAMGNELAEMICGRDDREGSVPISKPRRFVGYGFRHLGVAAGVTINRLLDTAERRLMS